MGLKFVQFICFGLFLSFDHIGVKANLEELRQVFVNSSYTFQSENYPEDYPINCNVTWCFNTNSGSRLRLRFDDIETELIFDFITVSERTATSATTELLHWSGRGNDQPPSVLSSENNLCLTFVTDSKANKKGFSGSVDVVSDSTDFCPNGFNCQNGVCLGGYDRCNGFVNCGNGADEDCTNSTFVDNEVTFQSMNYDNGGYVTNHHFTWYFMTDNTKQLELTFTHVNLSDDSPFDLILVGSGSDTSLNRQLKWHGNIDGSIPLVVTSKGSSMWVQFITDESANGHGFTAVVRSITTANSCSMDTFDCRNSACIPSNAQCDGFRHCPNGNDEENCPTHCQEGETPCSDGTLCFSEEDRCDGVPICFEFDDESKCEIEIDVQDKYITQYRDFNQTITFKSSIPGTHLLMRLFFLRTESRKVEANLTIRENSRTSVPLFEQNGLVDEYVITKRSSGPTLWLKFSVKGILTISVNVLNQGPVQLQCPKNISREDGPQDVGWDLASCNDFEGRVLTPSCSRSSGERFELGESTVVCTCMDSFNASSSCSFMVTITEPLVVTQILWIAVAVVLIIVILIIAFVSTLRLSNRGRKTLRNEEDSVGETDPINSNSDNMNQPVGVDNPVSQVYHSIDENSGDTPVNPDRSSVGNTAPTYSCRIYDRDGQRRIDDGTPQSDDSIPLKPIRNSDDTKPDESPYYSKKI